MTTSYLIEQIIKITKSKRSIPFYRKVIKELGENIVDGELGELKYQIRTGNVKHPAKYFNRLLQKQLKKYGKEIKPAVKKKQDKPPTQRDFFDSLLPVKIPKQLKYSENKMPDIYFPGQIPFPTFVGQEFFALSSNKKKSDEVIYKNQTADGKVFKITLIRGRGRPGAKPRGILTVSHGKVFAALIKVWTDQGCRKIEYEDGTVICFIRISARKMAEYLKWKKFGGSQLKQLDDILNDLSNFPYYYRLEELDIGLKGFGFKLLGDIRVYDIGKEKERKIYETGYDIMFSTTVSKQLLERQARSRPDDLITMRNEIAWKLRLYLEPRLLSIQDHYYSINLKNLIKELQLPKSKKHKYKSQRKQMFQKAVEEMNNTKTADGRHILKMKISPNKDKSDYKLVAFLENSKQISANI